MDVKKNHACPTDDILVDGELAAEVVALHLLEEAHPFDAHDQHGRELVVLVLGKGGDVDVPAPERMHEAGLDALAEHHIGELVVADVELHRIEMAGVVDVAALRDREPARAGDEARSAGAVLAARLVARNA